MPRPEGKKFFRQRERSEYDQRTLDIRRVSRTVKGGRRFSFRATIVMGNKNGKVAVGVGKGADVALAIAALAGIQNLTAKILSRSPNKLNNARATIEALRQLKK